MKSSRALGPSTAGARSAQYRHERCSMLPIGRNPKLKLAT
jgi:hypothetical protein